jgi:opacity protein-like surface antigen
MSAAVAFAQAPVSSQPLDRGYMTGTIGSSFGDYQTPTFGVELAQQINPHVQAYVGFTYFDDLISDSAQSDLDDLGAWLTRLHGSPWEFTGHDRGLLFSGGAKYIFANGSPVRPYLGAGPGLINLRRTIVESRLGDVSDEVLNTFGAPGGVIDAEESSTYKPAAEFLAGVGIAVGRTYIDVGYRYRHIFKSDDSFKFSQFSVGVGMGF